MKINLTRLLAIKHIKENDNTTDASFVQTDEYNTSTEKTYSFELEKK